MICGGRIELQHSIWTGRVWKAQLSRGCVEGLFTIRLAGNLPTPYNINPAHTKVPATNPAHTKVPATYLISSYPLITVIKRDNVSCYFGDSLLTSPVADTKESFG
jgi:hypothetical protein